MSEHKLAQRRELPTELTWDLAPVYADAAAWEKDFSGLDEKISAVTAFRGKLGTSPAALRDAYAALDALERSAEKLYVYAHLRADENTADGENSARESRIETKFAELGAAVAWFEPEIMKLPADAAEKALNAPEMAFYRRSFKQLLESRAHILSAEEETIWSALSDVLDSSDNVYSMLNNADMRFAAVTDEKGVRTELTHGNYIKFLESPLRRVRRNAFKAMFTAYRDHRHTCAATLDGTVKRHAISAKLRHFNSALAAALFNDRVPETVYTNLIDSVHANLEPLHRYLGLRKKVLKLKKLDMFDLHVPLRAPAKTEYTWEETKKIVSDALAPLGGDYTKTVSRAFAERWVDVPECRGKRSGAYSSGCFDTPPYLLLNFRGTLNDVFTLAHEMGHSMHSYSSNASQQYHYADYSIFVAEVASTTNEMLLHHHLMAGCADRDLKIYLLSHLIDEIRATVYRQTMFAEFELAVHRLSESGTPLTADLLDEKYYELNRLYYGLDADGLIRHEWARIPHFYYNFYVYKYATGMSAALKLAENIMSGDREKLDDYFGFLRAGSSRDVLDIMRGAGADLETPDCVNSCLALFDRTVKELESLL
ncbi:MAG: oligoendopeptidase F [Victivallaceae bacterium]|nr:oligoendopeptidase F [Victivallaceae bacterium]